LRRATSKLVTSADGQQTGQSQIDAGGLLDVAYSWSHWE